MQFDLTAKHHESRVLRDWLGSRSGGAQRAGVNNAFVVSSNNDQVNELFQTLAPASGFSVTDQTAMQVSTVYACLSKLAGAITQLPIEQYRLAANGSRTQAPRSPLWWMLNESPSNEWTAASWKEWIVKCVALRGDQFTEIVRKSPYSPVIDSLKVHHPDNVTVRRIISELTGKSELRYWVLEPLTGDQHVVAQDDMLHFSGFGYDGRYGRSLSMIQYGARSGIANALAANDYSGRSIGEGAMPQIALSFPNKLAPEQAKQLRESFVATYGTGTGSRKLPLVLTEGGGATPLTISPVDMDLLASRRFEREDICQALGVPPVLIGDNDKTSSWGTGIEQITLGFVKYTVKPHLRRWEEELNRKLFRNAGPFVEFDLDGLLRGDSKAQAEAFRSALGGPGTGDGYMTVNEIRRIKNLPPMEDGDELFKAAEPPDDDTTGTAADPAEKPETPAPDTPATEPTQVPE